MKEKKAGSTPKVATSFALIFTASQPIRSMAPVIGSIEATRDFSPRSITAPSKPAEGPITTSSRLNPRFLKITSASISIGTFPKGSSIYRLKQVFS